MHSLKLPSDISISCHLGQDPLHGSAATELQVSEHRRVSPEKSRPTRYMAAVPPNSYSNSPSHPHLLVQELSHQRRGNRLLETGSSSGESSAGMQQDSDMDTHGVAVARNNNQPLSVPGKGSFSGNTGGQGVTPPQSICLCQAPARIPRPRNGES